MQVLKYLFLPLSWLYLLVTSIRNGLYDTGIFKSYTFDVKVICVGNLSVGGTGKSPMIEYLIRHYQHQFEIAVLSRGYKRKTSGFVEVHQDMTADEVGDEPLQFKRKFNSVHVFVDADRKNGIEQIQKLYPNIQLILLDDAFQHRRVKADINILLTTYDKPFYKDFVLPVGRLRESCRGKKRADIIILTKCPKALSEDKKSKIINNIKPKPHQSVLFSSITYSDKIYSQNQVLDFKDLNDFHLITGIANPKPLLNYLNQNGKTFEHQNFPDHHQFTSQELENFQNLTKPILTTEKDYTRLVDYLDKDLFYLPIEVELDKDLNLILEK